ncbi:MAG: PEP/pyruvate-binding domain-containing protein, partial [Motiliproteus sp.]
MMISVASHLSTVWPALEAANDHGLPWLLPLSSVRADQLSSVGTKAVNLARMMEQSLQVPDGFVITTEAYRQGYSRLVKPALSEALRQQLLAEYGRLRRRYPGSRFAVRSSAPEEDGQLSSWAGMFVSTLYVESESDFIAAVELGFESLHSCEVSLFRDQQQGAKTDPAMALVVQCQVEAEVSGILFTRDPLKHNRDSGADRLCINAVAGMAEALASGEVNGDHYWLDYDSGCWQQQLDAECSENPDTGVLSDLQRQQLVVLAGVLEQQFSQPLDIEFAIAGQQIWLLQARPIVAPASRVGAEHLSTRAQQWLADEKQRLADRLADLQRRQLLQSGPGVLSNSNIAELLPSPTPMSFAIFNQVFGGANGAICTGRRALGYDIDGAVTEHLFEMVAGQPYFHLEFDARCYQHYHPLPVADYIDAVRRDPLRANYPEFGLYQQFIGEAKSNSQAATETCRQQDNARFHSQMTTQGQHYLSQQRASIEAYLARNLEAQRQLPLASMNAEALLRQVHSWLEHLRQLSCHHFVMVARLGFYFAESLRFHLHPLYAEETEHWMNQLLQALPGSRINQQSFDLHKLRTNQLSSESYLNRYGHLASNELELSLPRNSEQSQWLEGLCNLSAMAVGDQQGEVEFRQQIRVRKTWERKFFASLSALKLAPQQQQQICSDLRMARRFLPLRETIKYYYAGEYGLIRQALLLLAQKTGLDEQQIFYLRPEELPDSLPQAAALRPLIEQRQQQRQLAQEIAKGRPLAAVIFGDDIKLIESFVIADHAGGDRVHNGQPMSPGFIRGKVRLIDPSTTDLHQLMATVTAQDIIVTRSANLGLAPLMRKVAGLIVEVGGLLAHSACQAREAGIPAMVLPNATQILKEGG